MMDETTWSNRKYLIGLIISERQVAYEWIIQWVKIDIDLTSRVVTLAVAIIGVVVPVLSTRPGLADAKWLVRSTIAALIVVCVGVFRIWLGRYAAMVYVRDNGLKYRNYVRAVSENVADSAKITAAITQVEAEGKKEDFEKELGKSILLDCAFYGAMLVSLSLLVVAFVKR